jgi:tripartite-type tricarboxylate transporter receptor subunit TctC
LRDTFLIDEKKETNMSTYGKYAAAILTGLAALAGAQSAGAQNYPAKPVKIVVAVAPGGTTDLLGRAIAEKLTGKLGQPFIVENKPGGGNNIGMAEVAHAAPDGYTLLLGTNVMATNPHLYSKLTFNPLTDFAPVSMYGSVTNVLVVDPKLPIHNLRELIAYAQANPGKLTIGSTGNGTTSHLSGELIMARAGIKLVHVPYTGGAPAMTDLLGGHIAMLIDQIPVVLPHIKSGKVRPIAVTAAKRSSVAPDIPTVAEQGIPNYDVSVWFSVLAPAKTPQAIVGTLNTAIVDILKEPAFLARMAELGVEPMPTTPEQFAKRLRDDTEVWRKVIQDAGLKLN